MQESDTQPGIFGGILEKYADEFWLLFRVIFAILVFLHGAQKTFGWDFPTPFTHPLGFPVYLAGWVELVSAFLIAFGLLTRLGAGALCVTMVVAYFMVHVNSGVLPHIYPNPPGDMGSAFGAHGGEVTILWFIVAGVIGVIGGGKYALDRVVFKREPL
ncbi:MAG: DoxX family protein [Chloroflexi bacterium]|nr:DoxX family protein [Chloroflexota bacterium]